VQGLPLGLLLLAAASAHAGEIRGGTLSGSTLYTWGGELAAWQLPTLQRQVLARARNFGAGGCAADGGLVLQEDDRAILFHPRTLRERVFETGTRFASCLPFEIDRRKGILLTHLDAQLRFYVLPGFEVKELYSIYTASRQGGLLASDVDNDGLQDVFFGNYWVKNPGRLDVAWRLFAVNLWHDTPDAALAALALSGENLLWAESSAKNARIALFLKPTDPRQLWIERRLPSLPYPTAFLVNESGIFIGHAEGVHLLSHAGTARKRLDTTPSVALVERQGVVYAVSPKGVRAVYRRR
jgi:hypothetical protein